MNGRRLGIIDAEKLWEALCRDGEMPARITKLLDVTPRPRREEAVLAFARIMYIAGAQRGYLLAADFYDDAEEGTET